MILGAANVMEDRKDSLAQYLLRYSQGEKSVDVFFKELGRSQSAMDEILHVLKATRPAWQPSNWLANTH